MTRTMDVTVEVLSSEDIEHRIASITSNLHATLEELRSLAYRYELDLAGLEALSELERLEFLAGR